MPDLILALNLFANQAIDKQGHLRFAKLATNENPSKIERSAPGACPRRAERFGKNLK
jgi:hypothetical protein